MYKTCWKISVQENPYRVAEANTNDGQSSFHVGYAKAALLSVLLGAVLAGSFSYILLAWCAIIGSRVISDDIWFELSPRIFLYGSLTSVVPSLLSGLLNPRHPIGVLVLSHLIGLVAAGTMAIKTVEWRLVMLGYIATIVALPIIASVLRLHIRRSLPVK